MSLRLTFLILPGVFGMEFLSPPEWRKDVGISVHLSEVPLVPINLSSTPREGVSARPAHAASYRIACGAKKKKNLCKERSRNVFTNLYSSWNYSSSAVPLTDRGNTAERIYVSTYQDGELLGFVPSECGAFTVCTVCQEMWVDGRFGRLHFNLCKNHFTAWFETWWVEGEGPHITVYKLANWEALRRKIEQRRMNSCQNVINFEVPVEACAAFLLVKSILSNHWCTQPTIVIFTCYFW